MTTSPILPCAFPAATIIPGRLVDLERMDADLHGPGLWAAIGADPDLWRLIPPGPFADAAAFTAWLADRATRTDAALYTVIDKARRPVGLFFLLGINPAMGVVEMGLVYGPALSRRPAGTEAFFLLAGHTIGTLGYRRFEWHCDPRHAASRHAAERFGFTQEGVLRQTMWVKGRSWDTVIYAILDSEWPGIAARLAAWLLPSNFTDGGEQIRPLARI